MLGVVLLLLSGCAPPAQVEAPRPRDNELWRVVSYNIHHGAGTDERIDLSRIARVLCRLDADLVALQEVDERVERSDSVDQAAVLGTMLGMTHAFGSFMEYQGGRYGLAILSRRPLRNVREIRLPEGNEPRVALLAEAVALDGTAVTVINVHFDWVADDGVRFAQAEQVAAVIDTLSGPYILAGDFNDLPGSRTVELFRTRAREAVKPTEDRFTFSSTAPDREIDFIFAAPADGWQVRSVEVIDEPVASDHRPVLAALEQIGAPAGWRRPCPPEAMDAGR